MNDNFKTERLLRVEVDGKTHEVEAHDLSIAVGRNKFKTLRLWKIRGEVVDIADQDRFS